MRICSLGTDKDMDFTWVSFIPYQVVFSATYTDMWEY